MILLGYDFWLDAAARRLAAIDSPPWPRRVALGLALCLAGLVGRLGLGDLLGGDLAYVTFYPCVALAALLGGLPAGAAAALFSALGAHLLITPLDGSGALTGLAIFLTGAAAISIAAELLHRNWARSRDAEARRAGQRLTSLAAAAPGVIFSFRIDAEGKSSFPYASPNVSDVCGFDPQDIADDARPIRQRIHPEDLARVDEGLAQSARTLTLWNDTYRYDHPKKGEIWLAAHGAPVREPDGATVWHGYVCDMTERKVAEMALARSEARLQAVLDGAKDAIIAVDETGVVQSINAAGARMFGYRREEIIGESVGVLMTEPDARRHPANIERFLRTGQPKILGVTREAEGRRKDGALFPMEMSVAEVKYDHARVFVSFVRDLSERRVIEARIDQLQGERLRSMGGAGGGAGARAQPAPGGARRLSRHGPPAAANAGGDAAGERRRHVEARRRPDRPHRANH